MPNLKINTIKPNLNNVDYQRLLVEAQNVGVRYIIGDNREDLQSRTFNTILKRKKKQEFWALNDLSFSCYPGEIVGIIGINGSGKTTMCKTISGLIRPDKGQIKVKGEVLALLSIGTGFNSKLTGRENVYINGMMLGIPKRKINKLFPLIVEFSGLRGFIDEPLKNYSSGMKSRLAFSIAAMVDPEILIIDEALSAGDLEFSEKAGKKLTEIIGKANLVIIVSHQLNFIKKYCNRVFWVDSGMIKASGQPIEIIKIYQEFAQRRRRGKRIIKLSKTIIDNKKMEVIRVKSLGLKYNLSSKKKPKAGNNHKSHNLWKKLEFWVLNGIDFTINEGEIVGIIGRNGSGKTTLCKVLTGILKPDNGQIFVDGSLTALLTLGAGFNIQLSGRDNAYLNGLMLGHSRSEINTIYPDIIEFSELKKFMEQPVKNFSDGMRTRLAFSIAVMARPDVFIVDEILNAGDITFFEKASLKIQELIDKAKAAIVVTHNMVFVETICTRVLWLDNGIIKFDGDPKVAVEKYKLSIKRC